METWSAKPYIEGGVGVSVPDGGDNETFYALEVGSKVKITDSLSAYAKYENIFQEDDDVTGKSKSAPSTSSDKGDYETQSNRSCRSGSTPGGGMWFHRGSKAIIHSEWCWCYIPCSSLQRLVPRVCSDKRVIG